MAARAAVDGDGDAQVEEVHCGYTETVLRRDPGDMAYILLIYVSAKTCQLVSIDILRLQI